MTRRRKDLAQGLSFPENTIKSRLHRARERLGKALKDGGVQVRDIRQVGGLKERLDQGLAWLALDAVPGDTWDAEVVQPILQRESEQHSLWKSISFEFLGKQDRDMAAMYQTCCSLKPARRILRERISSFLRRD